MTISGMTISNGFAVSGGGIFNFSSGIVNMINCTLSGNTADDGGDTGGSGGAISNSGTMNITNSTLNGNTTNTRGGAIYNDFAGIMSVTNSTISNNSASLAGGAIDNFGTLHLSNSTVSFNSGGSFGPGGIYKNNNSIANVKSSIIALNTANFGFDQDVSGSFTSQGFNLIGKTDGSTGFIASTDQTGTVASPLNPRFDPDGLHNNGGPTQTIALFFDSPAIDKATSIALTGGTLSTDQRGAGFSRTFDNLTIPNATGGDGTDIGAFELQTATPTPTPTPTPTKLANISTRLRVETGDNVLIGGFIVTGNAPKKVIARALGPSLPVAGALANPKLEIYNSDNQLIAANNNWKNARNKQAIIDSQVAPTKDLESAVLRSIEPGAYTAIVRGVNGGTGVGSIEIYDLNRGADSQLANISSRGLVKTGDNVMIGGFIISGATSKKVIVRAIGPSLPVIGKLADPTLELFDGNGQRIAMNNNWRQTQQAQIQATGVAPTNDREAAIVATLPAAAYTAIVRGNGGTTGVALVEVYALD